MSNLGLDYIVEINGNTDEDDKDHYCKKIKSLSEQLELKQAEIQVLRKELDALRNVCTEMTRQRNRIEQKLQVATDKQISVVKLKNGKLCTN